MPKNVEGEIILQNKEGTPRTRWLDSVVTDLVVMGVRGW
jgi:hypothetical protein